MRLLDRILHDSRIDGGGWSCINIVRLICNAQGLGSNSGMLILQFRFQWPKTISHTDGLTDKVNRNHLLSFSHMHEAGLRSIRDKTGDFFPRWSGKKPGVKESNPDPASIAQSPSQHGWPVLNGLAIPSCPAVERTPRRPHFRSSKHITISESIHFLFNSHTVAGDNAPL